MSERNQVKKEEAYRWAAGQVKSKVRHHVDIISTLANTAAILKERFANFFWVGFYFIKDDSLILGPFQGPPACVKLSLDRGVCAACVRSDKVIIVDDVADFPGHVSCNTRSKSEIAVPIHDEYGRLRAILDVDSEIHRDFDEADSRGLTKIAEILQTIWGKVKF